ASRDHPDHHPFPTRRSSDLETTPADRSPIAGSAEASRGQSEFDQFSSPPVPRSQQGQTLYQDLPRYETPHQYVRVVSSPILKSQDRKSTRLNSSHVSISYAV